ncbi:MAG: ribulose-phosphate 3-epimerase [Candidatus Peribacteraceae bacterium]|nr:ribulose-phosphate 3-epimerase [Candidatus Peribacteraceae bacterium]
MALPILIAPSILSADMKRLPEEIRSIEPYADWLQIDVMDGHFVPNTAFPVEMVRTIETSLPLDIHLMVQDPVQYVQGFLPLRPKNITFHAEAVADTASRRALMQAIRDGGATVGIAINPSTPLQAIDDVLGEVDLLLVMSVNPGFGGQAFIPDVLEKVIEARRKHPALMIQMDGGIDASTAPLCIRAGANNLVSGNFIFRAADRAKAIASLRSSV